MIGGGQMHAQSQFIEAWTDFFACLGVLHCLMEITIDKSYITSLVLVNACTWSWLYSLSSVGLSWAFRCPRIFGLVRKKFWIKKGGWGGWLGLFWLCIIYDWISGYSWVILLMELHRPGGMFVLSGGRVVLSTNQTFTGWPLGWDALSIYVQINIVIFRENCMLSGGRFVFIH